MLFVFFQRVSFASNRIAAIQSHDVWLAFYEESCVIQNLVKLLQMCKACQGRPVLAIIVHIVLPL